MIKFLRRGRTKEEREAEFHHVIELATVIMNRISSGRFGRSDYNQEDWYDDKQWYDDGQWYDDEEWYEEGTRYFWLSTNPAQWSVQNIEDGSEEFFPALNRKGHKRRITAAFEQAKEGDKILFYEGPPTNKIVATGVITQGLHTQFEADMNQEVEGISFKYESPVNCVIWETIAGIQDLQGSSPIANMAMGSLFPLTEEEYDTILSLDELHTCSLPDDSPYHTEYGGAYADELKVVGIEQEDTSEVYVETGLEPSYAKFLEKLQIKQFGENTEETQQDLKLKSLYFEDEKSILGQAFSALANGKHLILYGPPGTGKSKLAKEICELYGVNYNMVTATSDWSTFDTIGGYVPEKGGKLRFNPGVFLKSLKKDEVPINTWLIIDEINRAEIDKAFGSLFSALTGDNITLPQKIQGLNVEIHGDPDASEKVTPNKFFIHPDWRIIATMNTFDKASLYEMSYAFMRRFSFIPIGLPSDLDGALQGLIRTWDIEVEEEIRNDLVTIWGIINKCRKIGPAIIEDILKYILKGRDYTSAIIIYVLPQFEGLDEVVLNEFVDNLTMELKDRIDRELLVSRMEDFFDIKFPS